MDSDVLVFILWSGLIIVLMSVVGYLIATTEPDPNKPRGGIYGNALYYIRLGRRKKSN